jgi:hypothetical protein
LKFISVCSALRRHIHHDQPGHLCAKKAAATDQMKVIQLIGLNYGTILMFCPPAGFLRELAMPFEHLAETSRRRSGQMIISRLFRRASRPGFLGAWSTTAIRTSGQGLCRAENVSNSAGFSMNFLRISKGVSHLSRIAY